MQKLQIFFEYRKLFSVEFIPLLESYIKNYKTNSTKFSKKEIKGKKNQKKP